ncbi:hypothetical protein [Pseudoclavibacter helvolus]|uniref:hypothetical protein n=1 Tax=Pseudoclavibacter helvolus TaxID=255205 RepID=UPI003C77AB24
MTADEAGTSPTTGTPSAAEAAERDALKSVRAVGEDRGDPDGPRPEDSTTSANEVDLEDGTDEDGFPVENPSG